MTSNPDALEAATRRVRQLWIANTILVVWLAVLSFAVIELRYGHPEAHEDRRVDQRIDDVTRCLWKLQGDVAKLGVETGDERTQPPSSAAQECPPLVVAPGPRNQTEAAEGKVIGTDARRALLQGVRQGATAEVRVGDRENDCIVIDPADVRASLRPEIQNQDQEINKLRLTDQDMLAADCRDGQHAVAVWTSNRHEVVGAYHRSFGQRWSEPDREGPGCDLRPDLLRLWRVQSILDRCSGG